ncbi:uncharacterized protein UTRI_03397_B [Ustilago trichophora]|uniref:Histone H1 n=1 Tax=Ustilago trichophora TaxID=86804 RepID=A0A5C3E0P6_9BASI|nr:uncharacterized protein UTRI_03397_B [Ustilago trichophora]
MTAATAPSPSPAPSAPPLAHTPSRQSPVDAIHVASDGSTRRHDASTSASPSKLTPITSYATNNLGTLAKPIDLASPPASPTLAATTAPDIVASTSTRPLHQPSPSPSAAVSTQAATTSATSTDASTVASAQPQANNATPSASTSTAAPRKPFASTLATPNRLLPPTPLGNAGDRTAASTSSATSTPSKPVHLPAPYKAPRLAQSGASESFATAYPTQETRQKYASPAKPLPTASGATPSHKRSWQSSGSVDLSNKKFRPTGASVSTPAASSSPSTFTASATSASPSPFGSTALPTARASSTAANTRPLPLASTPLTSRPLSAAPTTARAANISSGITVTNIPKPGSSLSNQAGVGPLNLIPAVSGTQLPASTRDEYLSLLQKSELIDLVKQLERQLNDLIAAPAGSSTLYRQARIYPNQIHTQIDRLRARQRIETSRSTSTSDLSLKDVYSLLNASASTSNAPTYTRTAGPVPRAATSTSLTGRTAPPSSSAARRSVTSTPAAATTTGATRGAAAGGTAAQKQTGTAQNASLTSLINSINAMVRQQAQPARGPNGAPLPPAQTPSIAPAARAAPVTTAKARPAGGSAPTLSPAALRSIVGDGPMPSNAALAAAIAAHFGGSLPGNPATATRPASLASRSAPATAASSAARVASAAKAATDRSQAATAAANRTPAAAASLSGPGKDISDKIAAILGSSSSTQTTMLGPQGLPLAPAAPAPGGSGPLPIGNIAAMLSSFAGQPNTSSPLAGPTNAGAKTGTPAAEGQENALSSLLQHFEEAKRRLPSQAAASPATVASPASSSTTAVQDPIAILTGASANPAFTPTYPAGASASTSPDMASNREASWSPDPEPVIVQGPLGTSTLPSYEDMIVEGLRVMREAPPRTLFNWMQVTYPLTKKFRPSAHQALQKAFKRGRLLKTGSMYRINPSWSDPGESRKPTRRPQVGRDHPMVTPGLNGEVLAVSPLKDSQAYRNVADSGIRTMGKGMRPGPRPYGQPGAAPLANPASSIFQNGSAASIILEYQKRTGKKLDADSVKQLYQLIRAGPSDGSAEEMLAHLLTQTGYHDEAATATAAAAAQTAAAAMSASMPTYARPSTSMPAMASGSSAPSALLGRTGAAAAGQRRMPTTPVAKGPTSLPLPTTSEPTMMQQLASMLNDLSSPINPVLANSLLGQLSSNAAAAAAARAANMPGMTAGPSLPAAPARTLAPAPSGPSSASSQLASALSSLTGQTPQQDLDSAVSETLAAALQQIGAAPTATAAAASPNVPMKSMSTEASAPKAVEEGVAAGASGDAAEEGIDLAEYEDAIRALTSAFENPNAAEEDGDSEESDVEADERAIAAAEAEPDSIEEGGHQAEEAAEQGDNVDTAQQAQTSTAEQDKRQEEADEGEEEEGEEEEEEEEEEDDEDGGEAEQMDLSAVLRQLTASLQAHHEGTSDAQGEDASAGKEAEASAATESHEDGEQPASTEAADADNSMANQEVPDKIDSMDVDQVAEEPQEAQAESTEAGQGEASHETSENAEGGAGSEDAASLQAQLEALVASLAANAGNGDDDDDEDDEGDDDGDDEEEAD